jgi:predicted XRE-type DNA-binding protein
MKNQEKQEYKKYLEELCDPNYQGGSWSLPENATPLEKAKHEICKQIVIYIQDNNLSVMEIAQKIQLSKAEAEDILYYRIDYFTLDRLVTYATRLLKPLEIKMIVEAKKAGKNTHAPVV